MARPAAAALEHVTCAVARVTASIQHSASASATRRFSAVARCGAGRPQLACLRDKPGSVASRARAAGTRRAASTEASASARAGTRKGGIVRKALKGVAVTTAVATGGLLAYAQYDEGTKRSLTFWSKAFPIYMHYRVLQFRVDHSDMPEEEADALYEELHEKYAPVAEEITLDLKGMYLKNAQLVSTRDEFMPRQYMDFCKRVQDNVPTEFGPGEARAMVEKGLGKRIEEVFEWFDDEVYGAASIGEVHRARRLDGREVVVKVQYPNIEQRFRSDMATMKSFCELAQPQHVKPLEEIEKQFMTEFDYRGEADNLRTVHDNVMPVWGKKVYIPEPHDDLCTKDVMVMDFVPGVRLVDGVRNMYRKYAEQQGRTLEDLEAEMIDKIKKGEIERRDVRDDARRSAMIGTLIKTTDLAKNTPRFLYNWTAGWVAKPMKYKWTEPPVNLGGVLQLLNDVHAHEIFVDGAFNGDPHPGNILLMPDGRLGLIDYGQVKRIDLTTRLEYAKLIVALARGTEDDVVDQYIKMGIKTKYMKRDILFKLASFWNDDDSKRIMGKRNIQTFMDWMQEQDPLDEVPEQFVMAARVSVMMRGMGNAFGLRMRTAPMWLDFAERLLLENGQSPTDAIPHAMKLKLHKP